MDSPEKTSSGKVEQHVKSRAAEIADSFEWVITALILAFVFRAFVMEAFRIPTGSMAETLMGAHFRMCCPACGYKYNYGFVPQNYGFASDFIPGGLVKSWVSQCPSCGYRRSGEAMPVSYGDRILVLKCVYQYFEPKRWDVVVFRNPLEPQINFIKRLAALPGETVEIIDGDVYINGQIGRKPQQVQDELWMPIYDNDYQPARPSEPFFNGHIWRQPFSTADSNWKIDDANPTRFLLSSLPEQINEMSYDPTVGNEFKTTYAYDDVRDYKHMPYCGDLMVKMYADFESAQGCLGVVLGKYQNLYKGYVDFSGQMVITRTSGDGKVEELARKSLKLTGLSKAVLIKFANVDHQLILQAGNEKLSYDLGRRADDGGQMRTNIEPQVKIFGSGTIGLSHVAVYRDIYYVDVDGPGPSRASAGNPFTLGQDEYFVLGDNSPNSFDCRWWNKPGKGNNGRFYRAGVVPRDYLVGKALFVYWPSGFKPFPGFPFPVVPNVGGMRFIYGGSEKGL